MKEHILKRTILIVGFICVVSSCRLWNIHADTYKEGMITIKHEELPVKRMAAVSSLTILTKWREMSSRMHYRIFTMKKEGC